MNLTKFLTLKKLVLVTCVVGLTYSVHATEDIKIINLQQAEAKSNLESNSNSGTKANIDETKTPSSNTGEVKPDLNVLYKSHNLTPEAALVVAQAAMKNCRDSGYQVSVAILDKGGNIQVLLRDRLAGIKTPDMSILKARTALAFRASTSTLTNDMLEDKTLLGVKDMPGVLLLAGGINITAAGAIIGALGVAGAPNPKFDERCAIIGLKPIQGLLEFAE